VNHSGFLLNLIKNVLFLLLKSLVLLLLLLDVIFDCLGVSLKLLKVSFQMLNSFSEIFIALSNTDRFIAILHILSLKSLNFILVLFFVSLHNQQLGLEVIVLCLLLLNS